MSDYYADQLAAGDAYERYVLEQLNREGIQVARLGTQADQFALGDALIAGQPVEIKFDNRFAETGRLFIEIAEKRRAEQRDWHPSGIFAQSSAKWYGVGDYDWWFVFRRSALRAVAVTQRVITIGRQTSRGFLMAADLRKRLCVLERLWPRPVTAADIHW